MSQLKIIIIALLAGNILLVGLEATKPPVEDANSAKVSASLTQALPRIHLLGEIAEIDAGTLMRECFTVGPFETRPTIDAIVEMLQEYTSSVSPRETEAFVDRGFWVYLPPFPEEKGARQAVNSLYEAGLEDVSLIKNGEWNNSVSLGYFVEQSNAAQHRDRVLELGFPAEFRIQRDDESRFWVDYEQEAGVEYASRVLSGLVPAELHRSTACPETNGRLRG